MRSYGIIYLAERGGMNEERKGIEKGALNGED
jgi:hypothetical protein